MDILGDIFEEFEKKIWIRNLNENSGFPTDNRNTYKKYLKRTSKLLVAYLPLLSSISFISFTKKMELEQGISH